MSDPIQALVDAVANVDKYRACAVKALAAFGRGPLGEKITAKAKPVAKAKIRRALRKPVAHGQRQREVMNACAALGAAFGEFKVKDICRNNPSATTGAVGMAVWTLCANGKIVRVRHGVYRMPDAQPTTADAAPSQELATASV